MDHNVMPYSSTQLDVMNPANFQDGAEIRLYILDWILDNYQMIMPLSMAVKSPVFVVGLYGDFGVRICLTPNNDTLLIEIFLEKKPVTQADAPAYPPQQRHISNRMPLVEAVLNLEFLDSDGTVIQNYERLPCRKIYVNRQQNLYWRKETNSTIFIDSLRIRSRLSLRYPVVPSNNSQLSNSRSQDLLMNDVKKMMNNESYLPDISIKVGDRSFLVHKAIIQNQLSEFVNLNSGSNVNHGEFRLGSINSNLETIFIQNENAEFLFAVLYYMYSGKMLVSNNLDYFRLYEFTIKYNIYELSKVLKPSELCDHSVINQEKLSFSWHVKDYSSLPYSHGKCRFSATFMTGGSTSWQMLIHTIRPQQIYLYLHRTNDLSRNIQTVFKLKVCNLDGTTYSEEKINRFYKSNHPNSFDCGSSFFINPKLIFNDTLLIGCDLVASYGQVTTKEKIIHADLGRFDSFTCWAKNWHENMLNRKSLADLSVIVNGEEMRVHKAILAARSPVFQRMLQSDMNEKLHGRVVIKDISIAAAKLAFRYIYTGKLENISVQYAIELYRTGDKYEIFDLRDRCKNFIINNLDAQHAAEVLMLSDLYDDGIMRKAAENITCMNAADTLLTSDGLELTMHHPELIRGVFEKLSAAFRSRSPQNICEHSRQQHALRTQVPKLVPYAFRQYV